MKLNKKTKLVFILVALFLIGLSVPSYSWTRKNVKEIETFYNSKLSPIIMIPGSSATENRFDGLVRKLNQDRRGVKHSLLKVKVWNNGRITFEGNIRKNDSEPIIVIGFENNNDGYSNIKKQAKMMNQAFEALPLPMIRTSWFLMLVFPLGNISIRIRQKVILKSLLQVKMPNTRIYQPMMK